MCRETAAQGGEETSKFSKRPPAGTVGAGVQPSSGVQVLPTVWGPSPGWKGSHQGPQVEEATSAEQGGQAWL